MNISEWIHSVILWLAFPDDISISKWDKGAARTKFVILLWRAIPRWIVLHNFLVNMLAFYLIIGVSYFSSPELFNLLTAINIGPIPMVVCYIIITIPYMYLIYWLYQRDKKLTWQMFNLACAFTAIKLVVEFILMWYGIWHV